MMDKILIVLHALAFCIYFQVVRTIQKYIRDACSGISISKLLHCETLNLDICQEVKFWYSFLLQKFQ
jgi:hypothetical protein